MARLAWALAAAGLLAVPALDGTVAAARQSLARTVDAAPAPPSSASADRLADAVWSAMRSSGVTRAIWGISVRSLSTGEPLFEHNAQQLLVPASIAKLVALAATVDEVGWDFTFDTSVRGTGPIVDGTLHGDLIIVGSGDPSIGARGEAGFEPLIEALKAAGISRVNGRLIGDDDGIDEPRPGAMWGWDDLGYASGAIFGALNYAENRLQIEVSPAAAAGLPAVVSLPPDGVDRPIVNRTLTTARGSRLQLWPEQRPGEAGLTIAGTIPLGSRPSRFFVSAGDPTRWFIGVLRRQMAAAGIEVVGSAVDIDDLSPKPDTASAAVLFVHRSKPLGAIAAAMLKDSLNVHAEAILRMSTGRTGGRTNDDALAALAKKLTVWNLPADGIQIVDGSGLSRRDTLAADTLMGILARMWDPSGVSPWMAGLPVAGRDGTLAARMRNTLAAGNLRAKTGTMTNIRSLAGYVRTRDAEPLALVVMVNNFEGTGQQAQAAVDAIAVALAGFARASP